MTDLREDHNDASEPESSSVSTRSRSSNRTSRKKSDDATSNSTDADGAENDDQVAQREQRLIEAGRKQSVAYDRLEQLFDEGTMDEIGADVLHRTENFGLGDKRIPGDGVVTACGLVNGRPVYAFSQDRTVLGGSLGEAHAKKIARLQDQAIRAGAPFVAINDSGGARIQEGVDALGGYGEIFRRNVQASGVIPQISLIAGPCAGGAVYSPALTDFVGMVEESSFMFLTGPRVVKKVTFEDISVEDLGGAVTHSNESGVSHFVWDDDVEAINNVRQLLSYLPSNKDEDPPYVDTGDDPQRTEEAFREIVPDNNRRPYDIRDIVDLVVDRDTFFEVQPDWAKNICVGFGRLGGHVIGIIGNQPKGKAGVLDIDASRKGARFIRTCNAYGIPLVSLVDVPGFMPGKTQEHGGVIDHGAKLLYAYCEATVPKISVILRKAYGGAYIVMSSKHVGGDVNLAWPSAEIAVMGANGAVEVLNRKEIAAADDPKERTEELVDEYEDKFLNPDIAASRGYIDAVIKPSHTRRRIHRHLRMMRDKSEWMPERRNPNNPL